ITGAATGIGREVVSRLQSRRLKLALIDVEPPATDDSETVRFFRADISVAKQVETAVGEAVAWAGGDLDAVLHFAGIMQGQRTFITELETATFERVIAVNLTGTFFLARSVIPHLKAPGGLL